MCPSYMVTREEKHSTRGRARLLFEMLRGDPLEGGWKNEYVKDALDLCLACKACKSECPINVDMATYKAEFLAHYYEGRTRPRAAYAMGLIYRWAGLARLAPWLVNFLGRAPLTSQLMKWAGGISQKTQRSCICLTIIYKLVPPARAAQPGPSTGHSLAGYLQQQLQSCNRQSSGRSTGARRLSGRDSPSLALLRPSAL